MSGGPEAGGPYADTRAHLRDELRRVDRLLYDHLLAWWGEGGDPDSFGGLFVSDEEVLRLLEPDESRPRADGPNTARTQAGSGGRRADEGAPSELDAITTELRARERRSLEAGVRLRLLEVVSRFGLSPFERDVLVCALAPDLDRKYEKVYGYLQDDVTRSRPTVDLLGRVLAADETDRLERLEAFTRRSPLVSERLIALADGPTAASRTVRVRTRVVEFLLGGDAVAESVATVAAVEEATPSLAALPVDDDRLETLEGLATRLERTDESEPGSASPTDAESPPLAAFLGPDEAAARAAVAEICAERKTPVVAVDASALDRDRVEGQLADCRREARLRGGVLRVDALGALERSPPTVDEDGERSAVADADRLERTIAALDRFPGPVFLTGEASVSAAIQPALERHCYVGVDFPRPDYDRRLACWRAVEDLPDGIDPATIAARYRLTSGEVDDAVETARALGDGALSAAGIREACRLQARRDLDEFAREVDPGYGWDDIVLPADTRGHLREIAGAIRHRGVVYERWGFGERFSRGNGVSALFTGPPGTGKTMAAEVIAGDVGLPLYALDLSKLLSKYIGETEKNLGRVFDRAANSDAILFFDEADALFGERTQVSDARDRYANVEVDYLLQRLEGHDGCVILATNLESNVDDAFERRIDSSVSFPRPDEAARREIWRSIFPAETPTGDLDVDFLGEFELTGGYIKNVAVTAAFMAAEDGSAVEMDHLVRALRREFQKTGKLFEPSIFGPYRDAIR